MNISRENIDDLTAVITIGIEPADYREKVENKLEDYRKKVRMDGFRPGKAPAGLVRKIYGKAIQADEIQQLLGDSLNNFIHDNNLRILGEPIPSEESPSIDWENDESFEFRFDIAVAPEVTVNLSGKDKFSDYRISITEEMIDRQVEDYARARPRPRRAARGSRRGAPGRGPRRGRRRSGRGEPWPGPG
ncbi:MAG: trigger factor family protein, partial [Bacteroidales bacterium]